MGCSSGPDIIEDGLVLCLDAASKRSYPGTGTTWTDLKGANNGTLTNGPTFDAGNGGSIVFDGGNDYTSLGLNLQNLLLATQQYSFVLWVYPTSNPTDSGIVANYHGNAVNSERHGFGIRRYGGGKIRNILSDSGGGNYIYADTASGSCPTGIWSHVTATWGGEFTASSFKIYINGQESQATSGVSGTVNSFNYSNLECTIGRVRFLSSYHYFGGNISNLSIYNRALTADEVRQNYLSTKERFV
jgi:hypothetical protein